jgi:hypothetical protein
MLHKLLHKMFVSNIWYSLCLLNALYTVSKLIELEVDMSMNLESENVKMLCTHIA